MKRFFAFSVFASIFFSACKKDSPSQQQGSDIRDQYVGVWECQENSAQNGLSTFDVVMNKSSVSSQITISNFYNYGPTFEPYATLNSTGDQITLPSQILQGNSLQGSGTLQSNNISFTYTVDNGTVVDDVTALLIKK